jgi:hypothetical protein
MNFMLPLKNTLIYKMKQVVLQPVRLAGGWLLVLICSERILLAGGW